MGIDPADSSSLEQKLDELLRRLTSLEELVAKQTQRVFALEVQQGFQKPLTTKEAPAVSSAPPGVVKQVPQFSETTPRPGVSSPPAQVIKPVSTGSKSSVEDLEARIGGNWLLWVGIVAIVIGTVYFLKLAFENNWIGPSMRVVIGILFGTGFVFWGEALQKHKYPYYGQTVTGGGIAILYLSIYAAFNFYYLVPSAAAFLLMILITATAAVLAARYFSLVLAFIGLIGGFLTPMWLSTGEDHQIILLSYIAILVVGVAFLARLRDWTILNYSSFILTLLIFLGWVKEFYSIEKRGTTELFLCVLSALFLFIGNEVRSRSSAATRSWALGLMVTTAIVLYVSSFANLYRNDIELLSFITLCDGLVLLAARRIRHSLPCLVAFLLNVLSILIWLMGFYREEQLASTLAFFTVIYAIFMAGPLLLVFHEKIRTRAWDLALITLAGMAFFGGLYWLLEEHHHGILGLLAVLMSIVYFFIANSVWKRIKEEKKFALMALGVAITFVTLAIPIQLKQNWITLSWAVEAVVLTWVAARTSSQRLHQATWAVMLLAVARLFLFDQQAPTESFVLIFNKRFLVFLAVILACYAIAWLLKKSPEEFRKKWTESFRAFILLASLLTVVLMTSETSAYYASKSTALLKSIRGEGLRRVDWSDMFRPIENSRQLAYSVLWGVYSMGLIVVGIVKRYRDLRYFAMALFAVTIAKVFFVDLASLERAYRVLSMIALGGVLLLAAFLYHRYRGFIFGE